MKSIYGQHGQHSYDWLYIDDGSEYTSTQKHHLSQITNNRIHFLDNRHYQLGAIAKGMSLIKNPNTIVCLVDGDDYLLGDALDHVAKAYQNPQVAMSYGNTLLDFRLYQNIQADYFFDKNLEGRSSR